MGVNVLRTWRAVEWRRLPDQPRDSVKNHGEAHEQDARVDDQGQPRKGLDFRGGADKTGDHANDAAEIRGAEGKVAALTMTNRVAQRTEHSQPVGYDQQGTRTSE